MRYPTVGLALVWLLAAAPVSAHHVASALGTVEITQQVLANGKMLPAGTYEIRDTGQHPDPLPGQSVDAQTYVEFVSNGTVVAREVAEVMGGSPGPVGTAGRATGRPRVEFLRGGDFLRVSTHRENERYLIHLPVRAR